MALTVFRSRTYTYVTSQPDFMMALTALVVFVIFEDTMSNPQIRLLQADSGLS